MKVINIGTKFRWRLINNATAGYTAICDRLNLTTGGESLEETMLNIQDVMDLLFKDLHEENELNQYTFDHSIDYRINEYENFVDVVPSPIVVE